MATGTKASAGLVAAFGCFLIWGLVPLYFKALDQLSTVELTAHRAIWSVLFVGLLIVLLRRVATLSLLLRDSGRMGILCLTSALLMVNWGLFIWAVNNGHIVAASLGYFIAPLCNVVLGIFILGERLSPRQISAVMLTGCGVAIQVVAVGELPWLALGIASSWSAYALIRKRTGIDPIAGLLIEMALVAPFAAVYLVWLGPQGGFLTASYSQDLLLVAAGIVTAMPLMLFTFAAQRLDLATVGIIQYLAPTTNLLLGILMFGEPFGTAQAASFALIWLALAIYSSGGFRVTPARSRPVQ